ncbi:MAG TPA: hypothetical protein PKV84_07755, partial [Candidatus Omnitrophota bacterium]|nr:hypothetical protein [Candidatus Omnitrophota bacterium]
MKKQSVLFLTALIIFVTGDPLSYAAETVSKTNAFKEILRVEGRGVTNIVTSPGEFIRTFGTERKLHPKAWPLS